MHRSALNAVGIITPGVGVTVTGIVPKHVYQTAAAKLTFGADGPISSPIRYLKGNIGPSKMWNRPLSRADSVATFVAPDIPSYVTCSTQACAVLRQTPNRIDVTQSAALDAFIGALITCGAWDIATPLSDPNNKTVFDALCVMRSYDSLLSRVNVINPGVYNLSRFGAPTFTKNAGWVGDVSPAYLYFVAANTSGLRYSQNVAFMMAKVNAGALAQNGGIIGTGAMYIKPWVSGDTAQVKANDTSTQTATSTSATGLWTLNRTASNAYKLLRDTTSVMVKSVGANTAPTNSTILVGANTSSLISTAQLGLAGFGGLARDGASMLSDAMISAINSAWSAYEAAIY